MSTLSLAIFASHGGSNLQSIVDACKDGILDAKVQIIVSNNSGSFALERAIRENIPYFHLSSKNYPNEEELDNAILDVLMRNSIDLVLLAGYMKKLGKNVLNKYSGKILNIHPSMLPKYSGKGMYGAKVHKAVIEAGEKKTGVTIHLVDGEYDTGRIINQQEIDIESQDDAESLAKRVLEVEHFFWVETLKLIAAGKIKL